MKTWNAPQTLNALLRMRTTQPASQREMCLQTAVRKNRTARSNARTVTSAAIFAAFLPRWRTVAL